MRAASAAASRALRPSPPTTLGPPTGTAEAVHGKVPTGPSWGQVIGPPAQQPAGSRARFLRQPVRPSPQSQSLSRGYGSNLPTSLTYIVLSTRGCSPWRPAADIGTAWHESRTVSPGFSRADGSAPDTAGSTVFYETIFPISGRAHSRESGPL